MTRRKYKLLPRIKASWQPRLQVLGYLDQATRRSVYYSSVQALKPTWDSQLHEHRFGYTRGRVAKFVRQVPARSNTEIWSCIPPRVRQRIRYGWELSRWPSKKGWSKWSRRESPVWTTSGCEDGSSLVLATIYQHSLHTATLLNQDTLPLPTADISVREFDEIMADRSAPDPQSLHSIANARKLDYESREILVRFFKQFLHVAQSCSINLWNLLESNDSYH